MNKTPYQQLPDIKDPSYWGIMLVKNFLAIIFSLFITLGLGVYITSSLTQLDITIKANVDSVEKCATNTNQYCALLHVTEAEAQQISPNNFARIEVSREGSYSRHAINGKVESVTKTTRNDKKLLPYEVTLTLDTASIENSGMSPTFAVIIVGSQPAWALLTSSLTEFF